MEVKVFEGLSCYGDTKEEADLLCKAIKSMMSCTNIKKLGLEPKRNLLAPWEPKYGTLHIKNVGYITYEENKDGKFLVINSNIKVNIDNSLFSTLYRAMFGKMDLLDISLCATEITDFFKKNNVIFPKFNIDYPIIPRQLELSEDKDIVSYVIIGDYELVFFNSRKVGLKQLGEEYLWVYEYSKESSLKDAIYYIAYCRNYKNIDLILRR